MIETPLQRQESFLPGYSKIEIAALMGCFQQEEVTYPRFPREIGEKGTLPERR